MQANFEVDTKAMQKLKAKYGEQAVDRAFGVVNNYTMKISADAKDILTQTGRINSGKTRASIKPNTTVKGSDIIGKSSAATLYARFIHEGVKHEGEKIVPMFVSFKTAPSLLQWAIRKGVILKKTKTGLLRKGTWAKRSTVTQWVLAKSGKPINIVSGGLKVSIQPTKFFQKPFEKHLPNFIKDIEKAVVED